MCRRSRRGGSRAPLGNAPMSSVGLPGRALSQESTLVAFGFDETDDIWKAEARPSLRCVVQLALALFAAVLPGAAVYTLWAWWNLSVPYRLLGQQHFGAWPRYLQWAHIVSGAMLNSYCLLLIPLVIWVLLGPQGQIWWKAIWWNVPLVLFPWFYMTTMQVMGLYEPDSLVSHLPMNLVWVVGLTANAAVFSAGFRYPGRSVWDTAKMAGVMVCPMVLSLFTSLLVAHFVFPGYARASGLHRAVLVNVVVPACFFLSQWLSWQCCPVLMVPGLHPGKVSRLLAFPLVFESFARRALLCGVQDLRLVLSSSLMLGVTDTVTQVTVDMRHGLCCVLFKCRYPPPDDFEHPGRRRLRAEALLLHFIADHLAIFSLSSFGMLTELIILKQPVASLSASAAALGVQVAVRFVFDVVTFCMEARMGTIARTCFRLERWHGIAARDVWLRKRRDFMHVSFHIALTATAYGQLYIKKLFEESLSPPPGPGATPGWSLQ